ncbi:MAG: L-threonylcarbamoyladenylate synthase [Frankiaceae bacterium]|nr:L-threonylcarbamoyladenylate synthase [Frankiaceae bacterium]
MRTFDCTASETREIGVQEALNAVQRGELVVLPTDTVYGVGADAFSPQAVTALLAAKGRGRDMPVPVLIGAWRTARALTDHLSDAAELLIGAFWPGALTVIVTQGSGLAWDLGDSNGTVALRMPLHDVAIDLLQATGPLAVSSANRTGSPAPTTADEAQAQLGDTVAVYLDGGPTPGATPSTIVDVTGAQPRLVREGAITRAQLEEAVGVVGIT